MARDTDSACPCWWLVYQKGGNSEPGNLRCVKTALLLHGLPAWPPVSVLATHWGQSCFLKALALVGSCVLSFCVFCSFSFVTKPRVSCLKSWSQGSISYYRQHHYSDSSYCSGLVKGKFPLYSPPSRYPELGLVLPLLVFLSFIWAPGIPDFPQTSTMDLLVLQAPTQPPISWSWFQNRPNTLRWSFWHLESCSGGSFSPSTAQGSVWQD